jgi:dihydroflavonol-4-reductase
MTVILLIIVGAIHGFCGMKRITFKKNGVKQEKSDEIMQIYCSFSNQRNLSHMKIAITGASGHIGNCLTRELIKQGAQVKTLVHHVDADLKDLDTVKIKGDLLDPDSLKGLCEGVDFVFHLAARISIDKADRDLVYRTNVEGTENLIKTSIEKKVKRFFHFSSIHAFNVQPLDQVLDETRPLIGKTKVIYESSKADGERLVLRAVEKGLDAVILNPTAVIGPFDYNQSFLGQALIKIYENKLPMLVPGGYNWVDVRDVARGAINAIEKGRKGERYLLSGHYYSLKQLAEMIGNISGSKTPTFQAPMFVARIGAPFISLYARLKKEQPLYTSESLDILVNSHHNISNEKAKAELSYHTRSLDETLRDTFQWYKQQSIINQ